MSARCWACAVGVTPVGTADDKPVGACWDCRVFGCLGHGERDAGSGKWHCFPSVATAIAAAAGVPGVSSTLTIRSAGDFEARYPALARALAADSTVHLTPSTNPLERMRNWGDTEGVDADLLDLAVKLGRFLLPAQRELIRDGDSGAGAETIFPRAFATLLDG